MMRDMRAQSLEWDPPLDHNELAQVLLITNAIEEAFVLFGKIEQEFGQSPGKGPVRNNREATAANAPIRP